MQGLQEINALKHVIEKLEASLKEKEALLKEIHHRTKNNLQVISSLLHLQVETAQDPFTKQILIECAARVKSMSMIHDMLYQTDRSARIDMQQYIPHLLNYLHSIYNVDSDHITLTMDIDAIVLNADMATHLGLIINELISNSFKHAFLDGRTGEIKLSFKKEDNNIILTVSDNGVGIPNEVDIKNMPSLGMQLIFGLAKQLNANMVLNRNHGTAFILTAVLNVK